MTICRACGNTGYVPESDDEVTGCTEPGCPYWADRDAKEAADTAAVRAVYDLDQAIPPHPYRGPRNTRPRTVAGYREAIAAHRTATDAFCAAFQALPTYLQIRYVVVYGKAA